MFFANGHAGPAEPYRFARPDAVGLSRTKSRISDQKLVKRGQFLNRRTKPPFDGAMLATRLKGIQGREKAQTAESDVHNAGVVYGTSVP